MNLPGMLSGEYIPECVELLKYKMISIHCSVN